MRLQHILFSFEGRISRSQYWIGALAVFLFAVAFLLVVGAIMTTTSVPFEVFAIVGVVAFLIMMIPGVAIGLKRLHDRDKGGWWLILFYVGPTALQGVAGALGSHDYESVPAVLVLASFVLSLWMIVELGFLRGTIGANRFGEDPLAVR